MGAALILERVFDTIRMDLPEQSLIMLLARKDEAAFEQVFKTHFKGLHAYACTMVKDSDEAEEIVQQVFFRIWERAASLQITGSVAAYLYRAVHNESLNYLKHQKVRAGYQMHVAYSQRGVADAPAKKLVSQELEVRFRDALNELPEQCRTIFQLSRFEELKYREIADKLRISVKTVENQMGKALKIMRVKLAEFLTILFILFTT